MPGNFAIRLRCPLCEADSWVTLADRRETYEQIQEQTWDFKCREHGAQQETPQEVIGVAPLDEKPASTEKSAFTFGKPVSTETTKRIPRSSERRSRKQQRLPKTLRVVVNGTDSRGHPFKQSSYTVDLSQDGARLDGIGFLTSPGQTIEVRRLWRKKRFRVVWIGHVGTTEANQVGVMGLQREKDIWHVELPEGELDDEPGKGQPPKK